MVSLLSCLLPLCRCRPRMLFFFFFFNDTATTEIYTLSLHDALPIYHWPPQGRRRLAARSGTDGGRDHERSNEPSQRSEEHTSELQSQSNLVCRLLLEKKKTHCTAAR